MRPLRQPQRRAHLLGDDAGDIAEDKQTRQELLERRANAYQAYYEHMPLSATALLQGGLQLYRSVDWGQLARIHLLDDRQYRDPQACPKAGRGGSNTVTRST